MNHTDAMNKELGLCWEVVVDDIVQHGYVNPSRLTTPPTHTHTRRRRGNKVGERGKKREKDTCKLSLVNHGLLTATSVTSITVAFLLVNLATLILRAAGAHKAREMRSHSCSALKSRTHLWNRVSCTRTSHGCRQFQGAVKNKCRHS